MHDIKWIREEPEALVRALVRRQVAKDEAVALRDKLLSLDTARRETLTKLEGLLARRNAASKEIGQAKAAKDEARAAALMDEVAKLKVDVPELEQSAKAIEGELDGLLAAIPNVPLESVPEGKDEHDNVELKVVGTKRNYAFTPKQHFELGEALGLMDFETASKLSGARFVVNKGPLARLERALGQFFLDMHVEQHGYTEVNPPLLVRDETMYGTAQLPKFFDDQFAVYAGSTQRAIGDETDAERYWLIPTAEVPLTNLVRDSILSEDELPLRFTANTPCFRAEAGSAGRDTRGMIRQHQFTKVEMVSITTPETSEEEHHRMLACAEAVLQKLDLHYRVVTLCTGDMGFASRKTFDIEVWLPGQNAYREISSCSVCGDFQARRMNARYRPAEGKGPRFVHTLNGSGVAVGRALVAVLETYQQEDGSIVVPDVLQSYMGGVTVIAKA
ncbi:seryl-tRNA synthetase, class IIa [Azorhizobium caulinodans ORS 571]|uniref:Serine--tRNA ligase n=1 Tax=Azorhizobium caulinodans (strain ATCC 43989 / DSM 5975 / JCM 20966 / LMG 6465 / NBRC 14845 / NCIMB 13405 / ORS 571) TaxID=438753 RepID=SYS_AZOC5|nr:serine--tRNA ligase [Azorhizobium caulinodans]A8I4J4.1 RecName: Full=Serine--tRNA ligase; AltName: Full=Seryl-tRNA synthetase; Short=SerRS; AltName: Full=Seryl-tRNA(Ser/Sec) synthetase [Azorhizobium caulinodans ORS 571]BAF87737.1 seryl-tRNA synthetase, class IIa [Azorhizobium caulinodans ORS 571]